MAEIEILSTHLVSSLVVSIYSAHDQMLSKEAKQVSLGAAVKEGIINNMRLSVISLVEYFSS
jgi:hypothetical protein